MRRTPLYDNFGELDDLDDASNVRPIATTPSTARPAPRGDVRYQRSSRRPPPRRASKWRAWIISGALGVAILSGVWIGLMLAFPPFERSSVQPAATTPADPPQAIVPEAGPAATAVAAAPAAATQPQPTAASGPERLPGIATVTAPSTGAQSAAAPKPDEGQAQAAATPEGGQQVASADGAPPAGQPTESAEGQAAPQPAEKPSEGQPAAEQAAAPAEANAQAQPGSGTPAPIPPPEGAAPKPEAPVARAAAPAPPPAARQQLAPKPAVAVPPPPAVSGGPFAISASVSPANPVSENAVVTVSVRATHNGAPLAGASCMATIHYRTATARQPSGGFSTGASGVGSFVLDAKGATYGHAVPIDVTCSGRGGTVSARTSFTPVRGR